MDVSTAIYLLHAGHKGEGIKIRRKVEGGAQSSRSAMAAAADLGRNQHGVSVVGGGDADATEACCPAE